MFSLDRISPVNLLLFPAPVPPGYQMSELSGRMVWIESKLSKNRSTPCLVLEQRGARFLMIYVHANGEDIGYARLFLELLQKEVKVHIIAVEFPGYGSSPGKPFENSVNAAVEDVYEFATKVLKFDPGDIIWFGRSIGTGPSTRLCSKQNARALVLMSPYSSIRSVVKHLLGVAASYLITNRFENKKKITKVKCPVLLIHGKKDDLIPPAHSEKLYERCGSTTKKLVLHDDMDHNNFSVEHVSLPIILFLRDLETSHPSNAKPRSLDIDPKYFQPPETLSVKADKPAAAQDLTPTEDEYKTYATNMWNGKVKPNKDQLKNAPGAAATKNAPAAAAAGSAGRDSTDSE